MTNRLHIASHHAIFLGKLIDNRPHKHHSIQVTIAIDSPFLFSTLDNEEHCSEVIVPPNIKHKIIGKEGTQLVLIFFPECTIGRQINNLRDNDHLENLFMKKLYDFIAEHKDSLFSLNLDEIIITIQKYFSETAEHVRISDSRIRKIFEISPAICREGLTSKDIAQRVFLSESRLQHLFKEEVGISLWQYIIWRRMVEGLKEILLNNHDLSHAAHEVGFADYSHMSNIFKNFFGYNLSEIFKNSRNLQVSFSNLL